MSKADYKKKALIDAYCSVNAISKKDADKPEHKEIINNALTELWVYPEQFDGESEDLAIKRREMETPAAGEATELANHFRELDTTLFGMPQWNVIFTMYNRMKSLKDNGAVAEQGSELSDKNNNLISEKEKNTMKEEAKKILDQANEEVKKADEAIDEIMKGNTPGGDVKTDVTEPKKITDETTQAARKKVLEQESDRLNVTMNARIDKVVISQDKPENRAVAGKEAIGVVFKPQVAFDNFVQRLGVKKAADGTVSFEKVVPGYEEAAMNIYNALVEARGNEAYTLKARVTDGTNTIKYAHLVKPGQTAGTYCTVKEIIDYIINEAAGVLRTGAGTQVKIKTAKPRTTVSNKGGGVGERKTNKSSVWSGIASPAWTHKDELIEKLGVIAKELNKDKKEAVRGFYSELGVKYYNGKTDDKQNKKTGWYRIPLLVEQYVGEIKDEELKAKYEAAGSVGRQEVEVNLEDKDAVNKLLGELGQIVAMGAANGVEGTILDAVRVAAAEQETVNAKAAAEDFAGME